MKEKAKMENDRAEREQFSKEKVKSVSVWKIFPYDKDIKTMLWKHLFYSKQGFLIKAELFLFDNMEMEETFFYRNGKLVRVFERNYYNDIDSKVYYDKNERKIKIINIIDEKEYPNSKYIYDGKNRLTEFYSYNRSKEVWDKTEWKRSKSHRKMYYNGEIQSVYRKYGNVSENFNYVKGKLSYKRIRKIIKQTKNESIEIIKDYEYGVRTRIIGTIDLKVKTAIGYDEIHKVIDSSGRIQSTSVSRYKKNGLLLETIEKSKDSKDLIIKYIYEYY